MRVQCPSCSEWMDPNATECPVCLRKRTKQEIFAGLRGEELPSPHPERPSWTRMVLWGIPGAMLIAYVVMTRGAPAPKAPEPAGAPSAAALSTPSRANLAAAPSPPAAGTTPAAPGAPTAPAGAEKPKPPDHWTLKGGVYDILSLKPVAGAEVSLRNTSSGEAKRAKTDAKGAFSVRMPLPSDAEYQVSVRAHGYRDEFLDDTEPSYLLKGAAERREGAAQLDNSQVLHVPIAAPESADSASYNFMLVPKARRGRG